MNTLPKIIIATRASRLALWQAKHVCTQLQTHYPMLEVELLEMTTRGDQILDRTLSKVGGKGLFVKELETALLDGRAHLAVHSLKDVPVDLQLPFELSVVMARADARDAFVSTQYTDIDQLPKGAVVGTSSLRREAQIRARYPHLIVKPLRGNLDTRLGKLDAGEYQAIILAAAGLQRLGLGDRIKSFLIIEDSLPAAGQGALGIETLAENAELKKLLSVLTCRQTWFSTMAERAVSAGLGGSCQVPLAAHAQVDGDTLHLKALVALPDGSKILEVIATGLYTDAQQIGEQAAKELRALGADEVLKQVLATDN